MRKFKLLRYNMCVEFWFCFFLRPKAQIPIVSEVNDVLNHRSWNGRNKRCKISVIILLSLLYIIMQIVFKLKSGFALDTAWHLQANC